MCAVRACDWRGAVRYSDGRRCGRAAERQSGSAAERQSGKVAKWYARAACTHARYLSVHRAWLNDVNDVPS